MLDDLDFDIDTITFNLLGMSEELSAEAGAKLIQDYLGVDDFADLSEGMNIHHLLEGPVTEVSTNTINPETGQLWVWKRSYIFNEDGEVREDVYELSLGCYFCTVDGPEYLCCGAELEIEAVEKTVNEIVLHNVSKDQLMEDFLPELEALFH